MSFRMYQKYVLCYVYFWSLVQFNTQHFTPLYTIEINMNVLPDTQTTSYNSVASAKHLGNLIKGNMAGISCGFMPLGGGSGINYARIAALDAISTIFKEIDADLDGLIKVEAFASYMLLRNIIIEEGDIDEMKKLTNEDGKITNTALQRFLNDSKYMKEIESRSYELMSDVKMANVAFNLLDKDGDGFLTKKEFSRSMRSLKDHQIDCLFSKFDIDHDEKLSLGEFKNIFYAKKLRAIKKEKLPKIRVTTSTSTLQEYI